MAFCYITGLVTFCITFYEFEKLIKYRKVMHIHGKKRTKTLVVKNEEGIKAFVTL
jgi:hypothetical protein